MKDKRVKKSISLKVWPFKKEDIAKLYWIDHPYLDSDNNWKMALYFKKVPDNEIRRCDVDWGTLMILRIGCLYKAGKLLFNENELRTDYLRFINKNERVFSFNKSFEIKISKYEITTYDGIKHSVVMNAFSINIGNISYHIPVIEVIRSILTKNRKLLYAILQPSSLDYYFLIEKDIKFPDEITINFSKDYPADLLTEKHVKHLIWLSTNINANTSWHEVYKSLIKPIKDGISFSFPFANDYEIRARFRQDGNIIRIEEILNVKGEKLGYKAIAIKSPRLHAVSNSDKSKKKTIVKIDDEDELIIETNSTGTRKLETIVDIPMAEHEFEDNPIINRIYHGSIKKRTIINEDTERILIDQNEIVSTGDIVGQGGKVGLEYRESEDPQQKFDGEIGEFILILKAMDKKYFDINLKITIGELPEGKNFCKLDDGITPRKYLIAEIKFLKGIPAFLIEIERLGKSLSTLVLLSTIGYDELWWNNVFDKVVVGLVNNNGVWDIKVNDELELLGIRNERFHHTHVRRTVWEMADKMYEKLINCFG